MTSHVAYIGIGSNMENPLEQCRTAIDQIAAHPHISITARSSFYETEPVGLADQGWFVNAVVEIRTSLDPRNLLTALLQIERQMGRVRREKWGPRLIDLDVLFYDDLIVETNDLKIPHPEIPGRRFILAPMDEIAGGYTHPALKKTMGELLARLPENPKARRLRHSN